MVKRVQTSPMLTQPLEGNCFSPMKTSSDAKVEAVVFLGLLRYNEDQLVERAKMIKKKDRSLFQEVFSSKIDEWTPMHACTLRGARRLVKLALKAGVDPNLEMGSPEGLPGRCTPLHLAAYRGDVSIVQLLYQSGAVCNKRDGASHTPLYYALRRGNTLAAKKLLKYGADPSELSNEERLYYEEYIGSKGSGLLCIPVRTGSHKSKNCSAPMTSSPANS